MPGALRKLLSSAFVLAALAAASPAAAAWCARGLATLPSGTCYALPREKPRGLVIFLHGLVDEEKGWQHGQQLGAVAFARGRGYAVLTPRGRKGIGPKGAERMTAWPTSARAQRAHLARILATWRADRAALEGKAGGAFAKTYVIGFSNGAYMLTSLATQQAFATDGWAAFAGGGGDRASADRLRGLRARPRFFVGWGEDDKAKADPVALGDLLTAAGWPSRARGYAGTGHAMTDAQLRDAFDFLEAP